MSRMLWTLATVALATGCGDDAGVAVGSVAPPPARAAEALAVDDERLDELRAAALAAPKDVAARRELGIALHDSRRFAEAIEHFERAVELSPGARERLDLALAYSSVSRLGDAKAQYQLILAGSPGHAVALHNLGNLTFRLGDDTRAIEYYERAIAARPDYLLAHYHLGDARKRAGLPREAYRTYERVLELEPRTPQELTAYDDALYQLASLDITMGATERGARMLVELLRANPEHPSANYALGQAMLAMGRPDDAQRAFDAHLRVLAATEPTGPAATGN